MMKNASNFGRSFHISKKRIKLSMKRITYIAVLLLIFSASIQQTNAQKIKTLRNIDWIEGKWMMEGKKGNTYEEWKIIDDNRMEGRGYKVFKRDTSSRETLEIVIENGEVFYIATVKDQNNGEPVRFKMTDGNRRHLDFENPEHDSPKKIKYQWKQNDHYIVELVVPVKPGSKKDKTIVMSFKKQ
jgi:hypothetical protein